MDLLLDLLEFLGKVVSFFSRKKDKTAETRASEQVELGKKIHEVSKETSALDPTAKRNRLRDWSRD